MSENPSEFSEMPDVAFAQGVMRGFVADRPGENLKHRLASAAAALGWSYARAKAVLYGEARVIKAKEMDQLRRAAAQKRVEELSHEREELSARLDRMEAMLAVLLASSQGGGAGGAVEAPDRARPLAGGKGASVGAGASPGNP